MACSDAECATTHVLNPSTGLCISVYSPLGRLLSRKELKTKASTRSDGQVPDSRDDLGRIGEWFRSQEERASELDTKLKSLGEVNRTSDLILEELSKIRAEVLELRSQSVQRESAPPPTAMTPPASAPAPALIEAVAATATPAQVTHDRTDASHKSTSAANAEVTAMRELVKRGIEPFSAEWRAILKQVKVRAENGEDISFD